MFRCNGWCYTWATAAIGGTNVCVRNNVSLKVIYSYLTILSKASFPNDINLGQLLSSNKVNIIVAGQLPASEIVMKVVALGFIVNYAYGMTKALGPVFMTK